MAVIIDGGGGVDTSTLLHKANNLSDLPDASTARTNLGLGTAATSDTGDFDAAGSAAAVQAASEPALGNPASDGYVLSSTTGGARSWVAQSGGVTADDYWLRNWAGQIAALLTSVTRTNYSDGIKNGFVAVTGTVSWPDGSTGHLDGVEYPQAPGVLQYFTASHIGSGKIVVQAPLNDGVAGVTVITPDYYVDSAAAGGGDGSLATPYNTLAGLPALQAGDVIAIKSGSTFTESFDFSDGVAVSIYRYGAGAKPILDARATIAAGSWSLYGAGAGSTYQASITWQGNATGITVGMLGLWEDGTRKTLGGSATGLSAGQYYIASPGTGSGTLYYRASDDGDLSAGAHTIKYTARHGGLHTTQGDGSRLDNVVFDGIVCIGACSDSGAVNVGESCTLRHVESIEQNKHNFYYQQGTNLYGCIAKNAYYSSAITYYILNQDTPNGGNVTHDACAAFLESGYAGVTVGAGGTGFHAHTNVSGAFGTISHSQCYTSRISQFLTSASAAAITLENPYSLNTKIPFNVWNAVWSLTGGYILQNDSNLLNAQAFNFLASTTATVDGLKLRYEAGTIQNGAVNVTTNSVTYVLKNIDHYVANLSGGGPLCSCTGVTGLTALITNSKIDVQAGRHYDFGLGGTPTSLTLKSNNNHFVDATLAFRVGASSYANFAAWVAAGYDTGSIAGGV